MFPALEKWFKLTAPAGCAGLAPIKPLLITVEVLVFADLITGVLAARKRKEPIRSAGLGRTVSKMLVYQLAVISGHLVGKYMIDDAIPVVKLVAGVIGLVELKS